MIISLILGGLTGWIAGKLMHSKGGILRNIILGIAGSAVGSWLGGTVGIAATGTIGPNTADGVAEFLSQIR